MSEYRVIVTDQLQGLTPSFPVTIGSDVHAAAKSVSMNDFGGPTKPELDNSGALTIGGNLKLQADSILKNFGTMTLGGLAEILNEVAGVDAAAVSPEKTFLDDLDVDSLSMVEVVVAAEEKFCVRIPDDDVKGLKTVGDAVAYIQRAGVAA